MAQTGPFTGELEDLYRGRYRHFLRVATAIVGDETSGHDAVQDGFAHALREQESFRSEGPLEAWVWRTVVNAALAARRRQVARREAPEAAGIANANGDADESAVRAWVSALPERLDYRAIADSRMSRSSLLGRGRLGSRIVAGTVRYTERSLGY
ncbi:MAG: RNA polymerase sigma factor [Gaiellaceae bacterium]